MFEVLESIRAEDLGSRSLFGSDDGIRIRGMQRSPQYARALSGQVGAAIPDEIQVAIICQHMGWTFEEYVRQPKWLIQAIEIKLNEEANEANSKK